MRLILNLAIAAICLLALPACKDKAKEQRHADLQGLMHGTTPDTAIKAAMEKAQSRVGEFLAAMKEPGTRPKDFTARKVFPAEGAKQQILQITELTYDGTHLSGTVSDNSAKPGNGIPPDGKVTFLPSEIVDWMYIKDGTIKGAFMLRALKPKLTPEEWQGFERQFSDLGLTFKEGEE